LVLPLLALDSRARPPGTIELIEKPLTGIIALLDEEVRMPKGADKTFLEKVVAKYKGQREFGTSTLTLSKP